MIRIFLNYLLPLLLPFLFYAAWVWFNKKHLSKNMKDKPRIRGFGVFVSLIIGIILMFISLLTMVFIGGAPPGKGQYESPRLENGKIVAPKMY